MYGFIDYRWQYNQADYFPPEGEKKLKPEVWAKQLVEFLWQQSRSVWDLRNDEVHDRSSAKAMDYARHQCEIDVRAIYASADLMSAYDRQMLDTPMEDRLNRPIPVLKRWIERTKPLVQHCIREQSKRLKKHSNDIRSFFTNKHSNTLVFRFSITIQVCHRLWRWH